MPGMDKTGPFGTGPAGRGLGPCGGGMAWPGRGRRLGQGRGAGWGRAPFAALSPDEEKNLLEQQKNWLETQLQAVEKRLQELA